MEKYIVTSHNIEIDGAKIHRIGKSLDKVGLIRCTVTELQRERPLVKFTASIESESLENATTILNNAINSSMNTCASIE